MAKNKTINVQGFDVVLYQNNKEDYISLTDIAKYKDSKRTDYIIQNWLRNRNTIELLGLWETLNNSDFKPIEFDGFRKKSGLNSFTLTSKQWIEKTSAIGLVSKQGRYGGTFAHKDIAFEFASWISVEFKLYIIKEFQRLKEEENNRLNLQWSFQRTLSKINYKIHTDAIRDNIIPNLITKNQINFAYASEADLLNVALFGKTAKEWKEDVSTESISIKRKNIRDEASIEQLVVLSNMESINALFIEQGLPQKHRLIQLNQVAIMQMKSLLANEALKNLSD